MSAGRTIDLNCDLGERPGIAGGEEALMACISSANIACGGHAGDEATMEQAVLSALRHGVAIGAHPGYADRVNFGRVELPLREDDIETSVRAQVRALAEVVERFGGRLGHVKPHGALYHAAARSPAVAAAVARGAGSVDRELVLVGLAGSEALAVWNRLGFRVAAEAFADRRYEPDGTLVSRGSPTALIADPHEAAAQALAIATGAGVAASNGSIVAIEADTIGLHADTPGSSSLARAVRARLEAAGITLLSFQRSAGPGPS